METAQNSPQHNLTSKQGSPPRILMTARETAQALGISERSIWRFSANGTLPKGILLGRCRRWSLAAIEEYIAEMIPPADLGRNANDGNGI